MHTYVLYGIAVSNTIAHCNACVQRSMPAKALREVGSAISLRELPVVSTDAMSTLASLIRAYQ